ncbi:MAG: DUF481 domain-containing protein, partial [bacterium]
MKNAACLLIHILLLAMLKALPAYAQQDTINVDNTDAPNVFLDCNRCDRDFIRREVTFVNYVRDRKDAQVHVLVTIQRTGSGGREYTMNFIGLKNFAGMVDTLKAITNQTDTRDDVRKAVAKALKLGFVRFVAKTPLAEQVSISYEQKASPAEVKDKWNYWVFDIDFEIFARGEESRNRINLESDFSANRVTDDWKLRLSIGGEYNEQNLTFTDDSTGEKSRDKIILRNARFRSLLVKSLNEHWSIGGIGRISSSTFNNIDLELRISPAIEYNVFKYSESTRKQLRFLYSIGYNGFRYQKETLFGKTSEDLFAEELSIELETDQPWGSISVNLEGSHFFHDFSKNRVELFTSFRLRLFKGFSLRIFGGASRIRDQLALPKEEASEDDIRSQIRELETSYEFFGEIGFSYTFGSIYSNVVNPR